MHPLGIGGKDDPVRLVFTADPGPALVVALSDMRDRFRLVANVVENVVAPDLPNLPVGRAVWKPQPDLATSAACWLTAGAAHHTVMTTPVGVEVFRDFAEIARTELLVIDEDTTCPRLPARGALEPGLLPPRPGDLKERPHAPARYQGSGQRRACFKLVESPMTRVSDRRTPSPIPARLSLSLIVMCHICATSSALPTVCDTEDIDVKPPLTCENSGAPARIRTWDPRIRSLTMVRVRMP